MEEKERYELFGEFGIIHDTSPNAECMLLNKFQTCEILNKQDKRIKEMEEENKELKDFTENTANLIDKLTEDSVFASTQLAIEELRKVQSQLARNDRLQCLNYIVNRIKELGGKENE